MRGNYIPAWKQIIARRAYDFACHVFSDVTGAPAADIGGMTDMTEWPKE